MSRLLTNVELPRMSRWLEGGPFAQMRDEMEQAFANMFGSLAPTEGVSMLTPRIDVSETDEAIEVDTDLPGFKADEIQIDVVDNQLTISGQHSEEKREEPGNGRKYHRIERRSGSFSRSVWLPCLVNSAKVEAQLKDGVLHIKLPKAEQAKRQKIPVKG